MKLLRPCSVSLKPSIKVGYHSEEVTVVIFIFEAVSLSLPIMLDFPQILTLNSSPVTP